jgi:hypothetical protein
MQRARSIGLAFLATLLLTTATAGQEPKVGSTWYEDKVDLGFKVKAPKDWVFVPGSPMERNLIGKYAPEKGGEVHLGKGNVLDPAVYLVKFDRRAAATQKEERQIGDHKVEISGSGLRDIEAWVTKALDEGQKWRKGDDQKPVKGALEGKVTYYEGETSKYYGDPGDRPPTEPLRAYVALFALSPELDLAVVGLGPADSKKWRGFESAYAGIAKSLQPLTLKAPDASAAPVGKDLRSQKRAKLEVEVQKSPGWSLYETPNYFILSNSDDKALIEEMKVRLEAIRLVYEKDYPPELSRKIQIKETPKASGVPAAEASAAPKDDGRSAGVVDALELGKCSVVRLCLNKDQYLQYGGRQGTSGYFSPLEEELLIFDDKEDEGRDSTWGVMNHEGFHQYIYAFFGNVAPHSWYNEGTGDYYSGFEFNLKSKKFTPKLEKGRQDNLLLIRDKYVPLKDFVTWDQAKYYGNNTGNGNAGGRLEGWACYAQGWSIIWFLRTGEGKAKGWQKSWGGILDKYLVTLLETADLEKALATAFEGVDWDALEASWRDYMM